MSNSEKTISENFDFCIPFLITNEIIVENKNISLDDKDILRPDFILYSAENQGMVILELKNISNATRQAGTELSAYAAEIRSQLIYMSDADMINVIISSEWPTLLCHYVSHEILWMDRKILCLKPINERNGKFFTIVDPKCFSVDLDINLSVFEVGGCQLCIYDNDCYLPRAC